MAILLRIRPNEVVKMNTRKIDMAEMIMDLLERDIFITSFSLLSPKMRQKISSRADFFCCETYYCLVALSSRDQDGGPSNSAIGIYDLTGK